MPTKTPDHGLIQAYLDDELADEDRRELEDLFDRDPAWAGAYREVLGNAEATSEALGLLDEEPMSKSAPEWIAALTGRGARASTGGVWKRGRGPHGRRLGPYTGRQAIPLARAAALVLVFGGALAAGLPGSPVRAWLTGAGDEVGELASSGAEETDPGAPLSVDPDSADADEVGVRVAPFGGMVRVVVPPLPSGSEVRVRLVDAPSVGVFGPNGTRFRTGSGQIEVLNPDRLLRVELPRDASEVTITVGGEVYLRKVGDRMEVSGPVSDSTETEIRFRPEGT